MLTDVHAHICDPVFDSDREEVLFKGSQIAGTHQTFWNSQGAATGSYLLRLESSGVLRTQKLILIK
ncbi:hypothetical protein HQ587_01415 [bacterium]|nr:hypothetical protein [bacterium]